MSTITEDILEQLNDDLVSHGWLAQCVKQDDGDETSLEERVIVTLTELLTTGKVEIGNTALLTPDYLEFVAWTGTVEERVSRSVAAVAREKGPDKQFAYWLCLRQNVDRFEGAEPSTSR